MEPKKTRFEKIIGCPCCRRRFIDSRAMNIHINRIHDDYKFHIVIKGGRAIRKPRLMQNNALSHAYTRMTSKNRSHNSKF